MWCGMPRRESWDMSQPLAIGSPVRSATDRKLLGVCGGFAERYGLDPLVVRIAIVVLSIFGGLGIVLYLAGAAWLPEPGDTSDLWSGRRLGWTLLAGFAALLILPGYLFGFGADGAGASVLLVLAVAALLVLVMRRPVPATGQQPQMATGQQSQMAQSVAHEDGGQTAVAEYGTLPYPAAAQQQPPAPPSPPRQRSYLGGIALGASVIWFGLAWLLNATDVTSMSALTIFGVSLAILGTGILVGAWIGRARWLVLFALPLSLVVWGLSAVPESVRLGEAPDWIADGVGDALVPVGDESFALGMGTATLDLGQWTDAEVERIAVAVGVGQLNIRVPEDWDVVVNSEVGFGSVSRNAFTVADGPDLTERLVFESADPDAPSLIIDARVDLGEIRIDVTAAQGVLQ